MLNKLGIYLNAMETIILKDGNTNQNYCLHVDKKTAEQCRNDIAFATNLLQSYLEPDGMLEDSSSQQCETETETIVKSASNPVTEWSRAETLALIQAYESHKENFFHTKKRKTVWEDIHNVLESEGIYKTVKAIETKWKNLLRTYKNVKDSNNKTGRGPTRFQYVDEMDIVMGNRPLISNGHTAGVGITQLTKSLGKENSNNNVNNESEGHTMELEEELDEPNCEVNPGTSVRIKSKKTLPSKTIYTLKRNYLKNKIEEIAVKTKQREEYYQVLKEEKCLKREREERKLQLKERELEMEEKKIKLLETYLKRST